MGVISFLICIAIAVFYIAAMWKINVKAGQPGWACIIPIYNIIVLLKIVGKPIWWVLIMLLPIVSFLFLFISPTLFGIVYGLTGIVALVYAIWMTNMLSKSFGKEEGFTVGLILLGFVFYPILGFGDAQYQGPYGDKAAFEAYKRNKN